MKRARNADYTKEYNRKEILRLLRRSPMSRAELARSTGLTRAATSVIADELLKEGIVTELPPRATAGARGRLAIPLAIAAERYYTLGVQLSRSNCMVGLCSFSGELLQQKQVVLSGSDLAPIVAALTELLQAVDKSQVLGIGICAPGPVDVHRGRILNPPRFDQWHGVDIAPRLSEALELPAYLENDACALALHQLEMGQSQNFLLLLVGNGVGSGIVTRGKLLGGAGNFSCELGHTSICFDGRPCACGNRGCLETYASISNLLEGTAYDSWQQVIDYLETDCAAQELLHQEAAYLSAGIINLLNLIQLDTVYLAGDICYGFSHLAPLIQQEVCSRALSRNIGPARILPADHCREVQVLAACDTAAFRHLLV